MRRQVLALALSVAAGGAAAHDTWFAAAPAVRAGEQRLLLGTGNRFPVQESPVPGAGDSGCRDPQGRALPLRELGLRGAALRLAVPTPGPATCWAQLPPQHITLAADKVAVYLDEIRAPAPVRQAWREQQALGLPWQERYTKHARVEIGTGAAGPVPLALDLVPDGPLPAAGGELGFTLFREGRPWPGQAVELVNGATGRGFWLSTDEHGRARLRLPLAGAWLLRGTLLEPDPSVPGAWQSHFFTLAFDLAAAGAVSGAASPSSSPHRRRRGT